MQCTGIHRAAVTDPLASRRSADPGIAAAADPRVVQRRAGGAARRRTGTATSPWPAPQPLCLTELLRGQHGPAASRAHRRVDAD